tara:strand:+ start:433 stop:828 length:396 start_codon:yes stop_codon:yes gene_type:complete
MATLSPSLTLTSTDSSSDVLSFTVADTLTVVAPSVGVSKINATATGNASIIVPATTSIVYLYVKHTGTTNGTTATAQLVDIEFTTDEAIARLGAGEFLFMPISHAAADVGVQLQVAHASVVQMEYAFFTKG